MKKQKHPWHKRNRTVPFNPDRRYLQKAIDDYLARGGRISTVIPNEKDLKRFIDSGSSLADADEFLLDH